MVRIDVLDDRVRIPLESRPGIGLSMVRVRLLLAFTALCLGRKRPPEDHGLEVGHAVSAGLPPALGVLGEGIDGGIVCMVPVEALLAHGAQERGRVLLLGGDVPQEAIEPLLLGAGQ